MALVTLFVLLLLHLRAQRRQVTLTLNLEHLEAENRQLDQELAEANHAYNQLLGECRHLDTENGSLHTAYEAARQQLEDRELLVAETRQQLQQDFQLLAGKALSERGEYLNQQHTTTLNHLLRPFQLQLQDFRKQVDDIADRDSRDRVSMLKEIEHLKELNQQVSLDATNLTRALRGSNKIQGQWGEMILSRLLESTGLRAGSEYEVQVAHTGENGQMLRPDVLVHLPDERTIIIDAKVSLNAYQDAYNAEDETAQQAFIRQHVESVKKQINLLAGKQYHQLMDAGSLDFVLLFIPIEGAFQMVVEQEPDILVASMQKKVILTSPSTLLAILRTIHHLWRLDEQNRNSLTIAKQAGNLYDKFVGFAEAFEEIGARLKQSEQAWHTARNRLATGQGNLITRAEELKQLGVQTSKNLPDSLRHISSTSGESS